MSIFLRRKPKHHSNAGALQDEHLTDTDTEAPSSAKKLKTNKHGQQVLKNGVVSMRELDLFAKISSKVHHEGATLFHTPIDDFRLTLGADYAL